MPDKCLTCGFRIEYRADDEEIKSFFAELSELRRLGLARYLPRILEMGTVPKVCMNSFCALGHVKYWGPNKKHVNCPDRESNIPGSGLLLANFLAIHHTKTNTRIAILLGIFASVLTAIGILLSWVVNS